MDTEYIYACRNISLNKGNGDTKRKCCAESMMSIKMCPASLNKFHILWRKIGYGNKGFIEFVCCCIVLHSLVSFSIHWIASSSTKKSSVNWDVYHHVKGILLCLIFSWVIIITSCIKLFLFLFLTSSFLRVYFHVYSRRSLYFFPNREQKKVHKWKEKYAL